MRNYCLQVGERHAPSLPHSWDPETYLLFQPLLNKAQQIVIPSTVELRLFPLIGTGGS